MPSMEGTSEKEMLLFLALTFGLEEDPPVAVAVVSGACAGQIEAWSPGRDGRGAAVAPCGGVSEPSRSRSVGRADGRV